MRRTGLRALVAGVGVLAILPAMAHATTAITFSPDILPDPVVAGSTGNGALTMTNASTSTQATGSIAIDTIDLALACKTFSNPCGSPDPGVIELEPGAPKGRAGTACAGLTFAPTQDPGTALIRFHPSSDFSLGQPGSGATATCTIDFAFRVLKMPTGDPDLTPGVQTIQNPRIFATHTGSGQTGFGVGNTTTTVEKATPVITPVLQPTRDRSKPLRFFARISGWAGSGQGTLTFTPFGPNNCAIPAGTPVTANNSIGSNGTYESLPVPAPKKGWASGGYGAAISYSGDANNNPVQLPCGLPIHMVAASKCRKKGKKKRGKKASAAKTKKAKRCKKRKR